MYVQLKNTHSLKVLKILFPILREKNTYLKSTFSQKIHSLLYL